MNTPNVGLKVASVVFGLVAFTHLVRLLTEVEVMIGSHRLPMWMSGVGLVIAALLSGWLWRLTMPVKHSSDSTVEHPHDATPAAP